MSHGLGLKTQERSEGKQAESEKVGPGNSVPHAGLTKLCHCFFFVYPDRESVRERPTTMILLDKNTGHGEMNTQL